jgi:hypothetical protein
MVIRVWVTSLLEGVHHELYWEGNDWVEARRQLHQAKRCYDYAQMLMEDDPE